MAKLSAGILSKTVGKVAGIVCSTWRGVNYIREKVTPANPNTPAQQTVRNMFSKVVAIAQQLLDAVIHTYWDVLQKGKKLTGYNRFCQANFNAMDGSFDPSKLIFTVGGLEAIANLQVSWSAVTKMLTFTWSDTIITNGDLTDDVFVYCYDSSKSFVFSQSGPATRSSETAFIQVGYVADIADLRCILFLNNGDISSLSQNIAVPA
jgi:hypothetical protein